MVLQWWPEKEANREERGCSGRRREEVKVYFEETNASPNNNIKHSKLVLFNYSPPLRHLLAPSTWMSRSQIGNKKQKRVQWQSHRHASPSSFLKKRAPKAKK
jgi:hypothetical protein